MPPRRPGARRLRQATPRTPRGSAISAPGTPSSGRGTNGQFVNGQWMCDCKPRRQAVLRETQKPGPNKGRWFYTCPQERRRQCKFFLWEDYAGVASGAGPVSAAGPSTVPRPTYRTSIGQRTTPPAERIGDPGRIAAPATAPRPASMQQPLPPPLHMAQSTGRSTGRQRIFATALHGVQQGDTVMKDDGDDSSEDEAAPPSPTPVRTRRVGVQNAARPTRSTTTRAATRAVAGPGPEDAEPVSNQITEYFGTVKKSPPPTVKEEKQGRSSQGRRACAFDDSDSEVDSDMDRAMVALAEESEQLSKRKRNGASPDTAARNIKKEDDSGHNDTDMESDGGGARARRIIVPVLTPTRSATRSAIDNTANTANTRSGSSRRRAGAAGAAADTGTGPDPESSFATLFNEHRDQPRPAAQQPLPTFSFLSSAIAPSQASTASLSQVPDLTRSFDTVATTPSSSFHTDAGNDIGSATDSAKTRKRTGRDRDPWYEHDENEDYENENNENNGASSDDDGQVTGLVSTENPFITPLKRVHFLAAAEVPRQDESGQDAEQGGSSVQNGLAARHKDHNVTRAVLQLLEGQQVEARVLQQIRALLNISFENHDA